MTTDLPDVNVLVALNTDGHEHRRLAEVWFDSADRVAVVPATQSGLLRALLNPAVTAESSPLNALQSVSVFLTIPGVVSWPDEIVNLPATPFMYALTGHRQVTDLHLLAIAASRRARLVTFDRKLEAALRPRDRRHLHVLSGN